MTWALLAIFTAGVVALSVTIAIIILHLVDKGLDRLILHLKHHPLRASNPIKYVRGYSNHKATQGKVSVHSQINLHKIIQIFIARSGKHVLQSTICNRRSTRQNGDTQRHNKDCPRYLKCFVPIKHIRTIVDWLRKRVNQTGKEPLRQRMVTQLVYEILPCDLVLDRVGLHKSQKSSTVSRRFTNACLEGQR